MSSSSLSESFTSNSSGKVEILSHNSNSSSVDGAEVGVFEQTNEVSFSGFLEGEDSLGLESDIVLHFHSNISDESLEGKLSDKQVSSLLVLSDFSQGDGTRSELMGLLDTSGDGSRLSGGLSSELLSGGLDTS